MTGTLFSDMLLTHDRSSHQNKSTTHSDYHPHSPHPCLRQPPLSSFAQLDHHPHHQPTSPIPSRSPIQLMASHRPTLPGIASLLAFAGQHPPAVPSPSPSHPQPTRLQSSDPIAHALPAFVSIPAFQETHSHPSPKPLFDSPLSHQQHHHQQHHAHRRRSSSITVVQDPLTPSNSHSPPPHSTQLDHSSASSLNRAHHHPQVSRNSRLLCPEPSRGSCFLSTSGSIPPTGSFRDLCHPTDQPFGKETYHSTSDASFPLSSSLSHQYSQNHIPDDPIQRRHSERIPGSRSQLTHHHATPPRRSTPPSQQHTNSSLNSVRSRQHSFSTALPIPSPASARDRVVKHIRRPSNASQSSSSSISGPVSVSSDFGASSLSIGSQSNLNLGAAHLSSSSLSTNTTFPPSCNDPQSSQTKRKDEHPHSYTSPDDHRSYNTHLQSRSYDNSSPQNHRQASTQSYDSPPNHPPPPHHHHHHENSTSPDMNSLSKLGGPMMNNPISSLGSQHHRYQCLEPGCGKTFSRPSSLKIHSYSHTGQKPFKCMRCDRAFSVQSNLKRHQKVHEKRSVAASGRTPPHLHPPAGLPPPAMIYEPAARRRMIEEESGEEDHESDHGMYNRMEE
ncbi:hypothetical protein PCANC_20998 [Puccinia coronata f. sp. avenae]|uniref:C2H2-type domain-containing protein n=1 Tax=Puccinia coronata f. sp. avenae TaxID=200324 RepID=A0A2N5U660_9BASI|nr:hypothetical protein PCANC_20998 [Puccinia coronata f. sp. avenae]